jgi:helix-turn-helix protein
MKQRRQSSTVVTVSQAAKFYNRSMPTIRRWCSDGLLIRVGCKVRRDYSGRWLIELPSDSRLGIA